jgi:hypothetical protein
LTKGKAILQKSVHIMGQPFHRKLTPAAHVHSWLVPDAIVPNQADGQETPTFEVGEYKQSQALERQHYAHGRGNREVQ